MLGKRDCLPGPGEPWVHFAIHHGIAQLHHPSLHRYHSASRIRVRSLNFKHSVAGVAPASPMFCEANATDYLGLANHRCTSRSILASRSYIIPRCIVIIRPRAFVFDLLTSNIAWLALLLLALCFARQTRPTTWAWRTIGALRDPSWHRAATPSLVASLSFGLAHSCSIS